MLIALKRFVLIGFVIQWLYNGLVCGLNRAVHSRLHLHDLVGKISQGNKVNFPQLLEQNFCMYFGMPQAELIIHPTTTSKD